VQESYIKYLENILKNLKEVTKSISESAQAQKSTYEVVLDRERKMSERDGLDYSDEELEELAMIQVNNSPTGKQIEVSIDKLEDAYLG
tara:strand:+ start:724 stop:987 length:264 start_codon:yes stop_codon:yes gene_type:complete